MQKKLAELINQMITGSPYKHYKCTVLTDDKTEGVYGIRLQFMQTTEYQDQADALLAAIPLIGRLYGETIVMPKREKVMVIR